jgi:hypothetical protein
MLLDFLRGPRLSTLSIEGVVERCFEGEKAVRRRGVHEGEKLRGEKPATPFVRLIH